MDKRCRSNPTLVAVLFDELDEACTCDCGLPAVARMWLSIGVLLGSFCSWGCVSKRHAT